MALFLVGLAGCQRGCLTTWLREHGIGGAKPVLPSPVEPSEDACPEGLARCTAGVVRVSKPWEPAGPCSPEGCPCPWEDAGVCPQGCSVEGLELEVPRELAHQQLCATPLEPGSSFATGLPQGTTPESAAVAAEGMRLDGGVGADGTGTVAVTCEIEKFHCAGSIVTQCDAGQGRPLALCTYGCVEGEGLIMEDVSAKAATDLLCLRHPPGSPD